MLELKYTEILRLNKQLGDSLEGEAYRVTVLSNIITTQFNEIFEYALRLDNIKALVTSGDYDNIVQDAIKYKDTDTVVIFWEACNLVDGLQYKVNLLDEQAIEALITKVCAEIDFVFTSLQTTPLVLFNKFSSLVFNHQNIKSNTFDEVCDRLNEYLKQKANANRILVDIDRIIVKQSVAKSVDFRYYYSSKALYTVDFYKVYTEYIIPVIKAVKGKAKKALIFDCDNTLWKGILGEDGFDKIEMSGKTKSGVVFEEVQHLALALSKKGILLGLCSKNNAEDVEAVIKNHPDMSIRNQHITIKKVNWNDKASNLKAIARELNIGLESIVFVDDSDFEVGLIKEQVPGITVLQVPSNLYEYPRLMRENIGLFYNVSESAEDLKRVQMYKEQAKRTEEKEAFGDMESYLESLQLKVTIYTDPILMIPRISQLTQKTNQFNLTTKRYTEANIEGFINSEGYVVVAFNVEDKYGDSGITGICILQKDEADKTASVDSFLMSCRVIGRNIELAFFNFTISYLKSKGIETLSAKYIKTYKNEQVANFYDQLGFNCTNSSESEREYTLELNSFINKPINYIQLTYGREN